MGRASYLQMLNSMELATFRVFTDVFICSIIHELNNFSSIDAVFNRYYNVAIKTDYAGMKHIH